MSGPISQSLLPDGVSVRSLAGLVAKIALLCCAVGSAALLATIVMAVGYREWVPPARALTSFPSSSAQCAVPTAPGWLLVLGAVSGAALVVLLARSAPVLSRQRRRRSTKD